jgi:hypothetical protein
MFPRLLASRGALFFYMSQTLTMTVVIVIECISQLLVNPMLVPVIVKHMFDDTETIGVLLISTGVLLECRETILKRAVREKHKDDSNIHLSVVEKDLEYYGVVLLIIGLTIELIVAISNFLEGHAQNNIFFLSVKTNFNVFTIINLSVLMLVAIIVMLQVIKLIYFPRKSS